MKRKVYTIEDLRKILQLKKEFGSAKVFTLVGTIVYSVEANLKKLEQKEASKKLLLKRAKEMGLI